VYDQEHVYSTITVKVTAQANRLIHVKRGLTRVLADVEVTDVGIVLLCDGISLTTAGRAVVKGASVCEEAIDDATV
jgi:hypothetical protein